MAAEVVMVAVVVEEEEEAIRVVAMRMHHLGPKISLRLRLTPTREVRARHATSYLRFSSSFRG